MPAATSATNLSLRSTEKFVLFSCMMLCMSPCPHSSKTRPMLHCLLETCGPGNCEAAPRKAHTDGWCRILTTRSSSMTSCRTCGSVFGPDKTSLLTNFTATCCPPSVARLMLPKAPLPICRCTANCAGAMATSCTCPGPPQSTGATHAGVSETGGGRLHARGACVPARRAPAACAGTPGSACRQRSTVRCAGSIAWPLRHLLRPSLPSALSKNLRGKAFPRFLFSPLNLKQKQKDWRRVPWRAFTSSASSVGRYVRRRRTVCLSVCLPACLLACLCACLSLCVPLNFSLCVW